MDAYRQVLKRVGIVLIVVGAVDIAYMVYCLVNMQSYSSSLNVFAVAAGIFLVRGHLGAVRLVTWISAFFLSALTLAALLVFPFTEPFELRITELKLSPISSVLGIEFLAAFIALFLWVYRQLREPSVIAARKAAGRSASPPKLAFVIGAALAIFLAVLLPLALHRDAAERAIQLAAAKEGSSYKYFVTGMSWSGDRGKADVTAYNDHEINRLKSSGDMAKERFERTARE